MGNMTIPLHALEKEKNAGESYTLEISQHDGVANRGSGYPFRRGTVKGSYVVWKRIGETNRPLKVGRWAGRGEPIAHKKKC